MAQVQKLHKYLLSPEAKVEYPRERLYECHLILKEIVRYKKSTTHSKSQADLFRKFNFRIHKKKGFFGYTISK